MSDWQPIETAPKDGTPIIGKCLTSVFDCRWVSSDEAAYLDGGPPESYEAGWGPLDCPSDLVYPTHWIPWPGPSGEEGGDE